MLQLRRLLSASPLLLALVMGGCADEGSGGGGVQSEKMATIRSRGKLVCGVDGKLPGFSFLGPDGTYSGLDADTCRAMAAALFGDPGQVEYRDLNSSERFPPSPAEKWTCWPATPPRPSAAIRLVGMASALVQQPSMTARE